MSPNVDDLKQSRFLSKKDVAKPILVTIKGYEQVNVARQNAEPDMRYVLHFREDYKPMTLTPTRGSQIKAITGSKEFDDWIGHKIVLYIEETVEYGSEAIGGIRCRAPRHQTEPDAPEPERLGTAEQRKQSFAEAAKEAEAAAAEVSHEDDIPF